MSSERPRVLVTRSPHQASELAERLRELGLEPVLVPTIEIAEPSSNAALDDAIANLSLFDWLLFTSANAVEAFRRRAEAVGAEAAEVLRAGRLRVGVIGASTARALEPLGVRPDVVPPKAVAESMAESLREYARRPDGSPARFLLVRAEEGRDVLPEVLRAAGAEVTVAPAYRTMLAEGSVEQVRALFGPGGSGVDAITFTSSSSARNLVALNEAAGVRLPEDVVLASMGPVTSATLRELGYTADVEAREASVGALAEAVVAALQRRGAC